MVQWTAEKDQIILKGIFKFHDIKSSAPLLKYLADQIGDDCTPKAVSHRLTNIRNGGGPRANGNVTASPAASRARTVSSTPTKPAWTSQNPRSRPKKSTPQKDMKSSEDSDEGTGSLPDNDEELLSPLAARGKRPSYTEPESEDDGEGTGRKRVKTEPVDDEDDLSFHTFTNGGPVEDFEV